ncbi:hypothetical protein PAHAL_2G089600 [Panicum hallii]|uniref:Uncharacterized protein n=1 Tax=Panicum hallii TaxID=206008 RepID=A0A2S3GWX4_9POAL|nr:hypothetical protein PAHAL_2G089600 [Panicum hallii]
MVSNSMAASAPALLLLVAMALTLAPSALAQLAPAHAPSPSQAFCPPGFDSLEAFQENAKQHGDLVLFSYVPVLGSSTSIASLVTGIQQGQNPTLNLCVCTPNPITFIPGLSGPKVICYLGSVTV